jgi:7-keto-8-aminopelargonate synthetase-like enzyme
MFTAGFRESSSSEIEITDCTYEAFLAVMDYIYTGAIPPEITTQQQAVLDIMTPQQRHQHQQRQQSELSQIVDVLQLADRFMLDHLKQVCEQMLQPAVTNETLECLFQVAQKTNAVQLLAICEHFARNRRVSN